MIFAFQKIVHLNGTKFATLHTWPFWKTLAKDAYILYILNENISMLDVKNLIGEALNGVQKSNPMPNSKLDIMECILSGFNSAII